MDEEVDAVEEHRSKRFAADVALLASVRDFAVATAAELGATVDPADLAVIVGELAANAAFVGYRNGVLRLALLPGFEYLQSERSLGALAQTLAQALGSAPKIVIETGNAQAETLHERADRQRG